MKKMHFKGRSMTPLLSAGVLIFTAPRMLELFASYTMPVDLKDFMIGLGVALVLGSFFLGRVRPSC